MAIAPTIQIDQVTLGAGSPGASRADGVVSQLVTLTDPANPGAQAGRLWEVFDADGASVTLSDNTAEAPTFTPGASDYGTFTVFVSYGDGTQSWIDGANGERIQLNQGGFAIAQPVQGNILPGAGETTQFGAAGFAAKLNAILKPVDGQLPTSDEKGALAGTGTPSGANAFVTNDDARMTDARTPTAHTHTESEITDLAHTDVPGTLSETSAEFGEAGASVGFGNSRYRTDAAFDIASTVTLEAWFKGTILDTTWNCLLGKGRFSLLNSNYALVVRDGEMKFQAHGTADQTLDRIVSVANAVDEWHHYAATRDSVTGETRLYFDGVEVGTATNIQPGVNMDETSNEMRVGAEAQQATPIEEGRVYEVRIWDAVRTPTEIADNYRRALSGAENGLLAYYKFDGGWLDSGPNGLDLSSVTGSPTIENEYPPAIRVPGDDRDAVHGNVAGEIALVAEKAVPISADLLLIEDSADSNNKKKVQIGNLPGGGGGPGSDTTAWHTDTADELSGLATKGTPAATDVLMIEDHALFQNGAKKKVTIGSIQDGVTGPGIDTSAIHDNIGSEINAITEKTTPVAADKLLIEDSQFIHVKKMVQIGNLPNGTADALATSGADVDVSAAAPPATGQVLKATSPTTATWQDDEAGGAAQALAAAQGDYLTAYLSTTLTDPAANAVITFDTVQQSRGDLSNASGTFSGLKAGRTYMLIGALRSTHSASQFTQYHWYDLTGAAIIDDYFWTHRSPNLSNSNAEAATGIVLFTPTVDSQVQLRIHGSTAGVDIAGGVYSRATIVEIGAVQAEVVGGLEFMDIIEVGADTSLVTFGAGGDGVFQRALDGDVDQEYEIAFNFARHASLACRWTLQPNGIISNQWGAKHEGGDSHNVFTHTDMMIGSVASLTELIGRARIQAETGYNRHLTTEAFQMWNNSNKWITHTSAIWKETATNITSLEVAATSGTIPAGSKFILYRRTRNNLRADSAAVYERMAMETVDPGALATTERTVGHTIYGGSVVGVSARVEDAVTAGSITVNVKVDGVTALSAVLDTTNPTSVVAREAIGAKKFAADKNISVEFVPSSYDNVGSVASAVTVQVHLTNDAFIAPPRSAQVESNLWYPPETPHADNVEFDSTELPAGWAENFTPSGVIDSYDTGFTSGSPRREIHTEHRRSWYTVQCPGDGSTRVLYLDKTTLPTNLLMVARCRFNISTTVSNNDSVIGLFMCEDGGAGAPGIDVDGVDDGVSIALNEQDAGVVQAQSYRITAGGFLSVQTSTDTDRQGQALAYCAIHKIGDNYHFWVGTETGSWIYLGVRNEVYAMRHVGLFFRNATAGAPGAPIVASDFIRFYETDNFLL